MIHVHGRCIVLLEGLDKTGKTTTAGEVATKLLPFGPVKLIHHSKPQGQDQFREYLDAISEADYFQGSTIIDRLHWSEEAYGLVYRKGKCLQANAIDALDEVLTQAGGAVVLKTRAVADIQAVMDTHDHETKGSEVSYMDLQQLDRAFRNRALTLQKVKLAVVVPFKQAVPPSFLAQAAILRSKSIQRKEN